MFLKPIVLEEAIYQRILRGEGKDSDFMCDFNLLTEKMSQAEREMFFNKIRIRLEERRVAILLTGQEPIV